MITTFKEFTAFNRGIELAGSYLETCDLPTRFETILLDVVCRARRRDCVKSI